MIKKIAAIDLGTNSFHIAIAEANLQNGRFRILGKDKEIVRLGSGSTDMKHISNPAMERGISALKRFKLIADAAGAEIHALGTSALREALNREEFIRRAMIQTGIKIDVASGTEEARLIHLGILQALPLYSKKILAIDIGGGSVEFTFAKGRKIFFSTSLKLGAVRLTERFFNSGKIDRKNIEECRKFLRGSLSPVVRAAQGFRVEECAGSSGTIAAIAGLIRNAASAEEYSSMNNFTFTKDQLFGAVDKILNCKSTSQISELTSIEAARADIITAGAILLEQIFSLLRLNSMTVSEYALREGIIFDALERLHLKKQSDRLTDIRSDSVMRLAEQMHYEMDHAKQTSRLSSIIFNCTRSLHHLGEQELELLEAAAKLHEIGMFLSHSLHHRHSYYLIRNSELPGFTENEKEIMANVARYHRKSHPKMKHEAFALLNEQDRQTVRKLAAILRIADGLDRSHKAIVEDIGFSMKKKDVKLSVQFKKGTNYDLEIWGAERKKGLFEEVFDVKMKIKPRT